jgi:predicted Zn-dependent protease
MTDEELEVCIAQIAELLDRNRFAQTQRLLDQALPHFPDDERLLYFSAYVALQTDNQEAAEHQLERVLELNPASYEGRSLMADLREEQGKFAESEALYLGILSDYPEDAGTMADYARLMLRTMHVEKAGKLAAEALSRAPDHPGAMYVATLASIVEGKHDERNLRLRKLLHQYPDMLVTAQTLVQVLHREGRYTEALEVAREMLRAQPNNEQIVEMVINLRMLSHWSMIPMRPFTRYGWAASIALWFIAVITFQLLPESPATNALLIALLCFVAYSWIWPWCLGKILRKG